MDAHTERLVPPILSVTSTKALGEWILANAANQGQWPILTHQEFLDEMSGKISDAVDERFSLVLPPDAPSDSVFSPPKTVACVTEPEPFEHAIDIDSGEPDIQPDPALLARGKQLCLQCPVRPDCLASGVQSWELEDGLYGGLTKQERQPIWQQNLDERLAWLQRAYAPVQEALLEFIHASDKKDQVRKVLIALKRQFANAATAGDEGLHMTRQFDLALRQALVDPVITERAQWLLPHPARIVMRHWMTACQEPIDPFRYDFVAGEIAWVQKVQRAERQVAATLRGLAAGEFNYRRWVKQEGRSFHNPITFLVAIGEPVPNGDIETLKQIGREKVSLLPPRPARSWAKVHDPRPLLIEHYGLGESDPLANQVLAEKYGISEVTMSHAVGDAVKRIRILCGNLENDDEEL
jgi:hypothetical protein